MSSVSLPSEGVGGVVIGGDFQGLGITRSLGRKGIPVCIIDNEASIGRYSRYTTHAVKVRDLLDERKTIQSLMEIGQRLNLKGWVLYPTRDETVAALSRHKEELSTWFRVPTPDWNTIQWTWDKRNTYKMADKLGIPTPRTSFPMSADELRGVEMNFPLVLKPAIKEHFIYTTKVKAWRADSPAELSARYQEAAAFVPPGEMMIQDMIPGGSEELFGFCAFFKEGRSLATMITQYKRQHPPQFGRSCTCVETIESREIEQAAEHFLRAINYYGLVELEFKRDARDGKFKLLDVNARTWGYHALGAAAGVDFAHLLFEDQLGRPIHEARSRAGLRWTRLLTDLPVGAVEIFRGQLSAGKYLQSLGQVSAESVFSREDVLPSLAEIALLPYLYFKKGF